MRASLIVCALVVVSPSGLADESKQDYPSLNAARRLYYAGIDGDDQAREQSARMLALLAPAYPDNPLVMAYFGSARLIESGRTFAVWRKGRLAKEGLAALDKAVAAAPDNLEVRFVRAISTFHLPGMFQREQQCREDFSVLARVAESAAATGRLERRLASAALFHHGVLLERSHDAAGARAAWMAAARVGPDTPAGRDAAARLKLQG
jgi:hypothetical protein